MKSTSLILVALAMSLTGVLSQSVDSIAPAAAIVQDPALDEWAGVYASPSIDGGSRDVLSLQVEKIRETSTILYHRHPAHDAHTLQDLDIRQDVLTGRCIVDRETIYIPRANGFIIRKKPVLTASVKRMTRRQLNGHTVLFTDYAYAHGEAYGLPGFSPASLLFSAVGNCPAVLRVRQQPAASSLAAALRDSPRVAVL